MDLHDGRALRLRRALHGRGAHRVRGRGGTLGANPTTLGLVLDFAIDAAYIGGNMLFVEAMKHKNVAQIRCAIAANATFAVGLVALLLESVDRVGWTTEWRWQQRATFAIRFGVVAFFIAATAIYARLWNAHGRVDPDATSAFPKPAAYCISSHALGILGIMLAAATGNMWLAHVLLAHNADDTLVDVSGADARARSQSHGEDALHRLLTQHARAREADAAQSRGALSAEQKVMLQHMRQFLRLHELFYEQAEKTPDSVAVVDGDRSLTYAELADQARTLANFLRKEGVTEDAVVPIFMPRCLEFAVSYIAALSAAM